jgi:ABC-type uncharacterized transport system ATPase subunit
LIYALTGLEKAKSGKIYLRNVAENGEDIELEHFSVRQRNEAGVAHIPEDRHRYGLVLDFDLQSNMVLERYYQKPFSIWAGSIAKPFTAIPTRSLSNTTFALAAVRNRSFAICRAAISKKPSSDES